jgi:hypothetical protein
VEIILILSNLLFVISKLCGLGYNGVLPVLRQSVCMVKNVSKIVQVKQKHAEVFKIIHVLCSKTSHYIYSNNCTIIRYNSIQTCGKPPTCFSLFRPPSGRPKHVGDLPHVCILLLCDIFYIQCPIMGRWINEMKINVM